MEAKKMNGLQMLKDIERKLLHIQEVVPEATEEEIKFILLRYFGRIKKKKTTEVALFQNRIEKQFFTSVLFRL